MAFVLLRRHYRTRRQTRLRLPDFLAYLTFRPTYENHIITGNSILPLDTNLWQHTGHPGVCLATINASAEKVMSSSSYCQKRHKASWLLRCRGSFTCRKDDKIHFALQFSEVFFHALLLFATQLSCVLISNFDLVHCILSSLVLNSVDNHGHRDCLPAYTILVEIRNIDPVPLLINLAVACFYLVLTSIFND